MARKSIYKLNLICTKLMHGVLEELLVKILRIAAHGFRWTPWTRRLIDNQVIEITQ